MKKDSKIHPFEITIGPGPYKFIGVGRIVLDPRRGHVYNGPHCDEGCGTCSHCSQAIMNIYVIQAGDGKNYGVGCDCIEKSSLPYEVKSQAKRERLKRDRIQRQQREQKKQEKLLEEYQTLLKKHENLLKQKPHPNTYFASQNKTLYDYITYCGLRSGVPTLRKFDKLEGK